MGASAPPSGSSLLARNSHTVGPHGKCRSTRLLTGELMYWVYSGLKQPDVCETAGGKSNIMTKMTFSRVYKRIDIKLLARLLHLILNHHLAYYITANNTVLIAEGEPQSLLLGCNADFKSLRLVSYECDLAAFNSRSSLSSITVRFSTSSVLSARRPPLLLLLRPSPMPCSGVPPTMQGSSSRGTSMPTLILSATTLSGAIARGAGFRARLPIYAFSNATAASSFGMSGRAPCAHFR